MPRERTITTINKYIEDEEKKIKVPVLFCFYSHSSPETQAGGFKEQ